MITAVTLFVLAFALYIAALVARNDVKQMLDELDDHEKHIS